MFWWSSWRLSRRGPLTESVLGYFKDAYELKQWYGISHELMAFCDTAKLNEYKNTDNDLMQ